MVEGRKVWTAIVLTCQNKVSAHSIQKELEIHQSKGFINKDVLLLTLEDPKARVGSGGATVNALLVVAEHLSAKAGFETLTLSVFDDANILIMHMGRDFPFSSCGRCFNSLPAKHTEESKEHLCDAVVSNFDLLLYIVSNIFSVNAPPGIWVCSTDMILNVPSVTKIDWQQFSSGIIMLLFQGESNSAKDHGVVKLGKEGKVQDIFFKGSDDVIKNCALDNGKVPLVGGIIYFDMKTAERILNLHVFSPLDACTYYGLDNGAEPIQLSLFFDILLCLAENITESAFVDGERSGSYGCSTSMGTKCSSKDDMMIMKAARNLLWKKLRGITLKGVVIENGEFDYMHPNAKCYRRQMLSSVEKFGDVPFDRNSYTHICITKNSEGKLPEVASSVVLVNTIIEGGIKIGNDSVVCNSHLQGNISIGSGCILAGIAPHDFKVGLLCLLHLQC